MLSTEGCFKIITPEEQKHLSAILEYDFERYPLPIEFDRVAELSSLHKRKTMIDRIVYRYVRFVNTIRNRYSRLAILQDMRKKCGCKNCTQHYTETEIYINLYLNSQK